MTPLKVFIPLDGSRYSEASLTYLSSLRALGELKPMLFSVVDEMEEGMAGDVDAAIKKEHNLLSVYLREVAESIEKHLGLVCDTRLAYGRPAEQVVQAAKDFGAELMLITTHGRSGARRWRLGSVADKVIRSAPCNTMVLGPNAAETAEWFAEVSDPFRQIMLPLDGSPLAEQAIPIAERFALRCKSVLHLVRVVTVPIYGDISADTAFPDLMDIMSENAERYVASLATRPTMPEDVRQKVLSGPPASELLNYVNEHRIDLVVMTTHGRGGLSRAAFGSVTDRLIGSGAPILVVKPAESARED